MYQSFTHASHLILAEGCSALFYQDILAIQDKDTIVVGFPGGSSIDDFLPGIRDVFVSLPHAIGSKILFVLLDERMVEISDPLSNFGSLSKKIFQPLIDSGRFHVDQFVSVDIWAQDVASEYTLRVPKIDIGLFGVGEDGHIASLFPDHPLLLSEEKRFLEITDSPKPPLHRITIAPNMIRDMRRAYVFFIGPKKQQAYKNFLSDSTTENDCPAKLIRRAERYACFSDQEI